MDVSDQGLLTAGDGVGVLPGSDSVTPYSDGTCVGDESYNGGAVESARRRSDVEAGSADCANTGSSCCASSTLDIRPSVVPHWTACGELDGSTDGVV